jgi:ligand-binding sensor domain-containing protein/signal transduction histidine kinase/DNA-binding response OmpR family regulator
MLVLLIIESAGYAQTPIFNHLGTADGLSQNSVLTIEEDSQGFMWFGTRYGLNRYDSRNFKVYHSSYSDTTGISNHYILSSRLDSRNCLWIGTRWGLNKYDQKTDTFKHFLEDSKRPDGLSQNAINCLYEDRRGRIWIGTGNGVSLLIDERTGRFQKFLYDKDPDGAKKDVRAIIEDKNGDVWAGTTTGLYKISRKKDGYLPAVLIIGRESPASAGNYYVTSLTNDHQGSLWIGTKNAGLKLLPKGGTDFSHFPSTGAASTGPLHNNVRALLTDKSGKIWIGTLEGLSVLDPGTKKFTSYQHNPKKNTSISNNSVYSLHEDKAGSVWVGTYHGGINVVYAYPTSFFQLSIESKDERLNHDVVSAISEDSLGNLWLGSEGGGLTYFNRQSNSFTYFNDKGDGKLKISSNLIKSILVDKEGQVWAATHLGGLIRIAPDMAKVTSFRASPDHIHSLSSNSVIDMIEDDGGRIWIATDDQGVDILDKRTGQFQHLNTKTTPIRLGDDMISALFKDSAGNIWIGTSRGVNIIKKDKQVKWFPIKSGANQKAENISMVKSIIEDSKKRIWLASYYGGLSLYNPADETFFTFTQKDGLKNENIHGILEDQEGKLWLSSDNGLSRFDPETRRVWHFDISDGLASNELTPGAFYKNSRGEMFFGSNRGLIHFDPNRIQINKIPPKVAFTGLRLFNKPVAIRDETGILTRSLSDMETVTFAYDQNIFTVEFAVLNYIKPRKNSYAYRLEGLENNWNYVESPSATYTNLSPGDYTLLIKGANNDGIWNETPTRLHIVVKPPLWRTWWAYLFYVVLIITGIFLLARFFLMRALLKSENEMHQAKLDFFTNVSHEIRTHLTLILGPVEKMISRNVQNPSVQEELAPVQNNGRRLLRLVNELMDFRKAESSHMTLQVSSNDLIPFLREIFASFSHLAETHHIHTEFNANEEHMQLLYDPVQLEKVIFNLMINAYKFTPDGGKISMSVSEDADAVKIEVRDNGKGIAPNHLKKLFVNFFQVQDYGSQNTGYGIGLALSKSIVEQHKGSLTVESRPTTSDTPGNTVFIVKLLKGTSHLTQAPVVVAPAEAMRQAVEITQPITESPLTDSQEKPTILLVEDNDEVRHFIQDILSEQYHILQSKNGVEGLEKAFDTIPDLIISDVMMDQMDGLELCTLLKSDARSSHIPVILLTAKTATSHQIDGLKTGADAYITKPFNTEMLELTIRNIFQVRALLRQKFSRQVTLEPRQQVINTLDEKFIDDIIGLTEERMEDPEFGVNSLLKEMGVSRDVLYKKLRALTGMSVNDFIKSIKLKKAAQLLREGHLTVNEVCFSVGYEDRRYFRQEFKKQFGVNPSEY